MSLINRLSIFFLAALALVLGGFSLALYVLASRHLHAQTDHRLDAARQTLVAAIDGCTASIDGPIATRLTGSKSLPISNGRLTNRLGIAMVEFDMSSV